MTSAFALALLLAAPPLPFTERVDGERAVEKMVEGRTGGRFDMQTASRGEAPAQAVHGTPAPQNVIAGAWTWVSGTNDLRQFVTYGTKGIAAPGNVPGARSGSVSWTDTNGDLWLFGGYGYVAGTDDTLNELWKFDVTSRQWTWVSGTSNSL